MNTSGLSMLTGRKILTTVRNDYCKVSSVNSQKIETLSEYVQRIRKEKKLSTTDVEKASNKQISSSYVTRIENEPNKNVSPEKLKALAKGLSVPEYEILTVAGFKNNLTPGSDQTLAEISGFFSGYEDLTVEDKEELKPMLVMLESDIRRRLSLRKQQKNKQ